MTIFGQIAEVYRRTSKPKDLLWNRFVARPLAALVLVPLAPTRITPNQVTLAALVVFTGAATGIALLPGWGALLASVAVLELAYVLDCVDGQLARLRGTSTPVGAHLDFLMDELKAFLLVAAVTLRLWRAGPPGDARWLLEGLAALVAVASAISLTTFLRRPEYVAATRGPGAPVGGGDGGGAGPGQAPPPPAASPAPRPSLMRGVEALGSFIVHYPSYIVFVALADRMDLFLHAYLAVNAAHVGRSLLAITWKLGRSAR
jgi:phosphatidylglycerophosphate synthase